MSKLVSHSAAVRSRDGVFGKTLRQEALVVNQFNDKRIMRMVLDTLAERQGGEKGNCVECSAR